MEQLNEIFLPKNISGPRYSEALKRRSAQNDSTSSLSLIRDSVLVLFKKTARMRLLPPELF